MLIGKGNNNKYQHFKERALFENININENYITVNSFVMWIAFVITPSTLKLQRGSRNIGETTVSVYLKTAVYWNLK